MTALRVIIINNCSSDLPGRGGGMSVGSGHTVVSMEAGWQGALPITTKDYHTRPTNQGMLLCWVASGVGL